MNNPVAYRISPQETLYFLLIGQMTRYNPIAKREIQEAERLWFLNIYSSTKTREIAMRRIKRGSSDAIFVKWDVKMEQIVRQGVLAFPILPDKVLLSDKLDICQQLLKRKQK